MVHRNDHAAALERARSTRARTQARPPPALTAPTDAPRTPSAEPATPSAERNSALPSWCRRGPRLPAPVACDYYADRGGGVAFFWLLLILAVSIGAVVGALWLFARA
jgi:hypothetical protein